MIGAIISIATLALCLTIPGAVSGSNESAPQRETVLDRKVHIEKDVMPVPQVRPLCEAIRGLKTQKIDIGGCKLYCEQEGKGTPIVLVAGGPGCTHQIFHPYFSAAAKYARVIYYDQRGVGQSDQDTSGQSYTVKQAVEDLDNLRKALKIEKWIVVGHSYGGFLAGCYALEHPESVLGLVLVCADPGTPNVALGSRQGDYITDEERARIEAIRADAKLSEEQRLYNMHINGDWKRQCFYRPTSDELARMALYGWKPLPGFRDRICADKTFIGLQGKFANFDIPTLIAEAKWDLTWGAEKASEMLKNHPGAKMVVFEKSGHSPFADEPDKFLSVLQDFIKSAKAQPTPPANRRGTRVSWPPEVLAEIMAMDFSGNAEHAASLLAKAEKSGLKDFTAWLVLGLNLYVGRDYEKSLVAFGHTEAAADAGGNLQERFLAAAWKGIVLDVSSRRDEALKSYQKALDAYKADAKQDPRLYTCGIEIDGGRMKVDPQWVEERLKTPFERK